MGGLGGSQPQPLSLELTSDDMTYVEFGLGLGLRFPAAKPHLSVRDGMGMVEAGSFVDYGLRCVRRDSHDTGLMVGLEQQKLVDELNDIHLSTSFNKLDSNCDTSMTSFPSSHAHNLFIPFHLFPFFHSLLGPTL